MTHSRIHLFLYSLLALPLSFAGLPIYIHAPEFYTSELGISIATIGFVLLVLRLFDAILDPFIGILSDRYFSYRIYTIVAGVSLLMVGFLLIFHPAPTAPIFYFSVGILLCTTGFSIVSINIQALGSLWKTSTSGRTRITSYREAMSLLGVLLAAILPVLLGVNTNKQNAFHQLSLLYLPALAIAAYFFIWWLRRAEIELPATTRTTFQSLRHIFHKWSYQFFGIYALNAFASAIPAVLVLFYIGDRLEASQFTGIFLMAYFLSGALGMPLWQFFALRLGKHYAWLMGMMLAVVSFVWAFTLKSGDISSYLLICISSGLALGADLSLPPSILADRIDAHKEQHIASLYFSFTTFLGKLALALATGIALPLLSFLGYAPHQTSDESAILYLSYTYALIPSVLKVCSGIWLYIFILYDKVQEKEKR